MIDACGTDTGECTHCGRWHDSLCSGARQDLTGEMAQELASWKRRALAAEERLTWIRGGLKTLAEADDMTPMVKP